MDMCSDKFDSHDMYSITFFHQELRGRHSGEREAHQPFVERESDVGHYPQQPPRL